MTTFNFNNVEVNEGSTYITPGVYDTVIAEVKQGKLPYGDNISCISITFETTDGKASHTEDFSLDTTVKEGKTKSMFDWTATRLKHLGTKVMSEEEFNKLSSIEDISAALVGKAVRIKFGGREYMNGNGEKKTRTTLPFMYFAENINTNPTRLTYDPNSNYDFKKLETPEPVTNGTATIGANVPDNGDLPF